MNELDILELDIGGQKLKDLSAFSFLQWIASKINNISTYTPEAVELTQMVRTPPMSRVMPNDQKIALIRKLQKMNISIP